MGSFSQILLIITGIKVWIRSDSLTGYCNQFDVYLGAEGEAQPSARGFKFDLVDKLTKGIRNKNHRLFMDSYYCSIPLFKFLQSVGIYACGTLMWNRKFQPPAIKSADKKWPRGKHVTYQDANFPFLTITAWKDVAIVRIISTISKPTLECAALRRQSRDLVRVSMPHCVSQYQKYMRGVDLFDQYRSTYSVGRTGKRVWFRLFFFMIQSSLVNSWILFRAQTLPQRQRKKSRYSQLDYRLELIESLVQESVTKRRNKLRASRTNTEHVNVHLRLKRPRRCHPHARFMHVHGKAKADTVYGCLKCGISICKTCHPLFHANM